MKVVFAMDSMKGSLTSLECGEAAATGLKDAIPDADFEICPTADGGEGTVAAVVISRDGYLQSIDVPNPIGDTVTANYGIIEENDPETGDIKKSAVIEIASAAGITLISADKRDPMSTTTYGVGEIIKNAMAHGCREFIIGLGGSATNDCGIGMLQSLGYRFYDENNNLIEGENGMLSGSDLEFINTIDANYVSPVLSDCTFRIASDVSIPLYGPEGASEIFGPQKGAFKSDIELMDQWFKAFSITASKFLSKEVDPDYPGSGAAGGLGFCFHNFLGAEISPGISLITEITNLKKFIQEADVVVTGEGRLDGQTYMGKAPSGVAHLAKVFSKPVIMLVGSVSEDFDGNTLENVDAYFPIQRHIQTLEEAMDHKVAAESVSKTTEQIFHLWKTALKQI